MKFKVLRQHLGDRMYLPGETREVAESEVKHLIASGVLAKAEPAAPANKAEPRAEANKAEAGVDETVAEDAAPHNKSRKHKAKDA